MPKSALIVLLALAAVFSGCGTVMNIATSTGNMPPKPFGGIAHDFEAASNGDFMGILDMPASFIGDVVTLPEVLVANEFDRNRVKSGPAGNDSGTTGARRKRVYTYTSETQSAEVAPAEQSDVEP